MFWFITAEWDHLSLCKQYVEPDSFLCLFVFLSQQLSKFEEHKKKYILF